MTFISQKSVKLQLNDAAFLPKKRHLQNKLSNPNLAEEGASVSGLRLGVTG